MRAYLQKDLFAFHQLSGKIYRFIRFHGTIIDTFAYINVFLVELKQIEKISRALADQTRLTILQDMHQQNGVIACSRIMGITSLAQPSVSHHVKTLIECGLIEAEKDGRNHSYRLNSSLLQSYCNWMQKIAAR